MMRMCSACCQRAAPGNCWETYRSRRRCAPFDCLEQPRLWHFSRAWGSPARAALLCCPCSAVVVLPPWYCVLREAGKCSEPLSTWRGSPPAACMVAVIRQTARGLMVVAWLLPVSALVPKAVGARLVECTCMKPRAWADKVALVRLGIARAR